MKIDWMRKLSSRKFWAAVSGVVISIMIIFGVDSASEERIVGMISSTGVLVTYILTEGTSDRHSIRYNNLNKEKKQP